MSVTSRKSLADQCNAFFLWYSFDFRLVSHVYGKSGDFRNHIEYIADSPRAILYIGCFNSSFYSKIKSES